MIRNYFKIALRNFWNNKVLSLINILGLSIGISAALVIFLIVAYEFAGAHSATANVDKQPVVVGIAIWIDPNAVAIEVDAVQLDKVFLVLIQRVWTLGIRREVEDKKRKSK